jgi:hypothetical protein
MAGPVFPSHGLPPRPRKWTRLKEVAVFQMIDQASAGPQDRKTTLMKVGMFVAALAALGGVVYFFAFVSYASH